MTKKEAEAYVDKLTTEEKLKLAEFLDMLEAKRWPEKKQKQSLTRLHTSSFTRLLRF